MGPERLADFEGRWRIDRRIRDARAGDTGRFTGTAEVRPAGELWVWQEEGELRLPGRPPLLARRRYLWREGRGAIRIAFDDGRPFHDLPLAGGTARHDCAPDLYRVRYDFARWPRWTACWRVTGPAKDYALLSRHSRP